MSTHARPRLPVLATVIVAAAVAIMIALGIWQLGRAQWKADLLEHYRGAEAMPSEIAWPRAPGEVEAALYRRSALTCDRVLETRSTAGRSAEGLAGWSLIARCLLDQGGEAEVALGWSREPVAAVDWGGGPAIGFVAPAGEGARLVASPPLAGLEQLARPDPNDLPNNHLAYAGQWFLFAASAVAIYALALRRRAGGS